MRRNRFGFGLYDLPLWKDWLAYLTLLGVLAAIAEPATRSSPVDAFFGVAVQFLVFGAVPGALRLWVRRGRAH